MAKSIIYKSIVFNISVFVIAILSVLPLSAQDKEITPAEFVEYNLAKTRERLAKLKENYKKQYGSADLNIQTIDPAMITEALPKPHQLKFIIRAPEKKITEIASEEKNWPSSLKLYPVSLGVNLDSSQAAADDLTSAMLRLPRKLVINAATSLNVIGQAEKKECCTDFKVNKTDDGRFAGVLCTSYATESILTKRDFIDPRALKTRLSLDISASPGAQLSGNGAAVIFNTPGAGFVKVTLPNNYNAGDFTVSSEKQCLHFDYEEKRVSNNPPRWEVIEKITPRSYKDGAGKDQFIKVVTDWKIPSDKGLRENEVMADVIAFKGVRIDGQDYTASGKEAEGFDFFARDKESFKTFSLKNNEPDLILHRAAQKGVTNDKIAQENKGWVESIEPASKWRVPLTYNVLESGPFAVSQNGDITPLGGIGEAKLRMQLGQHWSLIRKITANRWSVDLDPTLADRNIAPGARYRLAVYVEGTANMANYNVDWSGGGTWQDRQAGFARKGQGWIAENFVTIPNNAKPGTFLTLSIDVSKKGRAGKTPGISWKGEYQIVPAIASIDLQLAAKGQPASKDGIDLFLPNHLPDGNRFMTAPSYKDKSGNELDDVTVKRFLITVDMRLNSDTPSVAQVDSGGGQTGMNVGEAWITAQIGGTDLDPTGKLETAKNDTLTSNGVKVTSNQLLLSRGEPQGGFTSYTLRVIGPADMNKYQALFHYPNGSTGTPFIQGGDGSQMAGISTVNKVTKVEILKSGKVVAMLLVNDNVVLPQPGIKLMPIALPGKVVDSIDPVTVASVTSTADCRKMLRTQYPAHYGSASDDVLNAICDSIREEEKADIKEQRETQKAQKKILRSLKKQGRKLMVFSDSTQVGTVVTGNFNPDRMNCRWRIDKGGSLVMEQKQTQVIRVGSDGACFNTIKGFQGNFDTDATVTVELMYAYPAVAPGQFVSGATATSRADMDRKTIEEWVNK